MCSSSRYVQSRCVTSQRRKQNLKSSHHQITPQVCRNLPHDTRTHSLTSSYIPPPLPPPPAPPQFVHSACCVVCDQIMMTGRTKPTLKTSLASSRSCNLPEGHTTHCQLHRQIEPRHTHPPHTQPDTTKITTRHPPYLPPLPHPPTPPDTTTVTAFPLPQP